jgi:hypothetical protein
MNNIKQYISKNNITFLVDIDKSINVNKFGKSYYQKFFRIDLDLIKNFINIIEDNKIFLVFPLISVSCRIDTPYLNLSRQFLITNKSNPNLIYDFINCQLDLAYSDFGMDNIKL